MTNEQIADKLIALRSEAWQFIAEDPKDPDDETAGNVLAPIAEVIAALGVCRCAELGFGTGAHVDGCVSEHI